MIIDKWTFLLILEWCCHTKQSHWQFFVFPWLLSSAKLFLVANLKPKTERKIEIGILGYYLFSFKYCTIVCRNSIMTCVIYLVKRVQSKFILNCKCNGLYRIHSICRTISSISFLSITNISKILSRSNFC